MPTFYALVDAVPGREHDVGMALGVAGVAHVPCKEKSHDFLIRFEAPAFYKVDEFLQTHVRRIPGVKGVEIIVDWDDHTSVARDARAKLG